MPNRQYPAGADVRGVRNAATRCGWAIPALNLALATALAATITTSTTQGTGVGPPTIHLAADRLAVTVSSPAAASPSSITVAASSAAVSAHRGGAQQWPQDSLEAYTNALAAGFAEIEGDTWITADGITVIEHDDKISPTRCSGPYVGKDIWQLTYAQVEQETCEGQPIPTEQQLLHLVKSSGNPRTVLRLETKTYPGQPIAGVRAWAEKVGGQVVAAGLGSRSIMQDFDWNAISAYHVVNPKLRVSALITRPTTAKVQQAEKLGAYDLSYDARYATVAMNTYIAQHRLVPTVWGIDPVPAHAGPLSVAAQRNDRILARRIAATGVRVMITNNPALVVAALSTAVHCREPWHNLANKTIKASTSVTHARYFHTVTSAPWGTQLIAVRVWQTAVSSARVLVSPEGLPSADGRYVTLKKNRTATLSMRVVEYYGVRMSSSRVASSRMHLMTVGDYPLTCD